MHKGFETLTLPKDCHTQVQDNTLCVTKWNWDYADALAFQQQAQSFISKHKDKKIFIFCNHPHVFTLGRGNERGEENLVDFDQRIESNLSFPLYKIRRGGGITFHYPGQWIFYPIVAIRPDFNLENLMCWMLKSVATTLKEDFDVAEAITANKLMGVWVNRRKIASIGLGINRFITEHGLALNLQNDEKMFAELRKVFPCGLEYTTYLTLEELNQRSDNLQAFHQKFLERLFRQNYVACDGLV